MHPKYPGMTRAPDGLPADPVTGPVLVFRREPAADRMPLAFAVPFAPPASSDPTIPAPHPRNLPALVHRLTPEDGLDLVLPFGEVCELLFQQLEAPQRLQPRHRLACKADVFATRADAPWPSVLETIHHLLENDGSVAPLTPRLAGRLGLQAFLGAPRPVVSLFVTEDPTASERPLPVREPAACASSSAATIPERFTREWEFLCSRREAIAAGRAARKRARSWWSRLWARATRARVRREADRWRQQMAGRSLEDQLWAVRPDRRLLLDTGTRRWVRGALEFAGFDPERMLGEWEIYWRRKGV